MLQGLVAAAAVAVAVPVLPAVVWSNDAERELVNDLVGGADCTQRVQAEAAGGLDEGGDAVALGGCRLVAASALALLGATSTLAAIAADEITALPGWDAPLPSRQYSGLIQLPGTQKMSHYWFVEAQTNASAAPVVLWLNGGPGCSSLDGYLYEHGPFHVNESNSNQLLYNPSTWTTLVSVIYLESPIGVGYSYSPNSADYFSNDTQSAEDNYQFLQAWFTAYPEFANNEFYLSGESYAGVYVPMLAHRISTASDSDVPLNLKGFMVGNGCTGNMVGICGYYFNGQGAGRKILKDFLTGHALVSLAASDALDAACGNYSNPSAQCSELYRVMQDTVGDVNAYDIYTPCIQGGRDIPWEHSRGRVSGPFVGGPDDCIDGIAASAWINTPEVIKALHVEASLPYVKQWTICSSSLKYTTTAADLPGTIYPDLVTKYRVLVYNGDVDACVPYQDNESWTASLNLPVDNDWHAWVLDNQVGGYATSYIVPNASHDFQFITVKGSGHMVPQYQPVLALEMLKRYINNTPF